MRIKPCCTSLRPVISLAPSPPSGHDSKSPCQTKTPLLRPHRPLQLAVLLSPPVKSSPSCSAVPQGAVEVQQQYHLIRGPSQQQPTLKQVNDEECPYLLSVYLDHQRKPRHSQTLDRDRIAMPVMPPRQVLHTQMKVPLRKVTLVLTIRRARPSHEG